MEKRLEKDNFSIVDLPPNLHLTSERVRHVQLGIFLLLLTIFCREFSFIV